MKGSLIVFSLDPMNTTMEAYFTSNVPLLGDVLNKYVQWNHALHLHSSDHELECAGFCYFQSPDPVTCELSIHDSSQNLCFMGTFRSDGPGLDTPKLAETTIYTSRFVTGLFKLEKNEC